MKGIPIRELIEIIKGKGGDVGIDHLERILSGDRNPGEELKAILKDIATRWESPEAANCRLATIEVVKSSGWTISKIASAVDVSRTCVRRLLNGERLDSESLQKLNSLPGKVAAAQVASRQLLSDIMEGRIDVMPECEEDLIRICPLCNIEMKIYRFKVMCLKCRFCIRRSFS